MEARARKQYGFSKEEIRFLTRNKPVWLFDNEEKKGIAAVTEHFISTLGYNQELIRTLVVKYPHFLSKTPEQIEKTYSLLREEGLSDQEITKLLFDCPKLISMNLEMRMPEIFHLFELYHKIPKERVMEIFKKFPYLFCCDLDKIRLFMCSFRKYRLTQD